MIGELLATFQDDTRRILVGIACVLIVASFVGQTLKITIARREAHATINNLNRRINAWWVMAVLVGLALLAGRSGVTLLFALASLAALYEFVPVSPTDGIHRVLLWISFLIVLPLQYLLVWNGNYALFTSFIPLYALIALPMLGWLSGYSRELPGHLRTHQGGLLICVFCISFIPALLTLRINGDELRSPFLLVFLLLVVQMSDVLQYLWGKVTGRHPIAPKLSPSKTIEGTVGGILSACILGIGLHSITPFTMAEAALVSLLITLLGFLGGLTMSAIKRSRGIKDWSYLIPGHGGMLDRLDSLWLSAPVFYYLLRCR